MNDKDAVINLIFAGDYAPCRGYETLALNLGSGIFGDLKEDILAADLAFLNLEAPLCTNGQPISKTGPNLRADPGCLNAVVDAGFDVVGLANNHIMDYGSTGLSETLSTVDKSGLMSCGAGPDILEAQQPAIFEVKGFKVALIAVAEHEFGIASADQPGAAPLDPIDNVLQIEQARDVADLVFVTIHGGNEYFPFPRPGLRKICRYFIDRGVDGVVCHHAHVPGAYEIFKGKLIVYSLGNLIFDNSNPPNDWEYGYAVRFNYSKHHKELIDFEIIPYRQSVSLSGVNKLLREEKESFINRIRKYNEILCDNDLYLKEWERFCISEKNIVLFKQYSPIIFKGMRKLSSVINPQKILFYNDDNRNLKLNMIRCESHLELLRSVLGDEKEGYSSHE